MKLAKNNQTHYLDLNSFKNLKLKLKFIFSLEINEYKQNAIIPRNILGALIDKAGLNLPLSAKSSPAIKNDQYIMKNKI